MVSGGTVNEGAGGSTDSRPEDRVSQDSAGFVEATFHGASGRPFVAYEVVATTVGDGRLTFVHLREDVPDPRCGLGLATARAEGGEDAVVDVVSVLSDDVALDVVCIHVFGLGAGKGRCWSAGRLTEGEG